jgi:N-acetylglucosaminyldiphosphoundecaprenol N-acetyl-beta-D-mannosaminyltransferase
MVSKHSSVTPNSVSFAGLRFKGISRQAIWPTSGQFKFVITINADLVVMAHRNPRFRQLANEYLSTLDGQVPYAMAKLFAKPRRVKLEKISGSDLVIELLQHAATHGKRVFLLGAAPQVNAKAVEIANTRYGTQTEGFSPPLADYPFTTAWRQVCLDHIRQFKPHYLFVAFGAPKQEFWLSDELDELKAMGVEFCVGCGGSLDFLSGNIQRAPRWIQHMGLEGVFRLLKEPKLFRVARLARSFLLFRYIFKQAPSPD